MPDFTGEQEFTTWDGEPVSRERPRGATVVVASRAPDGWRYLFLHRVHHGGPAREGDWAWTPPSGSRKPGEDLSACVAALTAIAAREANASQAAGIPWSAIPQPGALPAAGMTALAAPSPACADVSGLTAGQITGLARKLSAAAGRLETWLAALTGLAGLLGLRAPVTFADASGLLALAGLAAEPDRPERSWLSAAGQRAATSAAQVLYDARRALATAQAEASTYFTPDALRHDVAALVQRLVHDHRGPRRLSGDYRAARKTVRTVTRAGIAEETAQEHLALAASWKHAAEALAAAERSHAALLGAYYPAGPPTSPGSPGRSPTPPPPSAAPTGRIFARRRTTSPGRQRPAVTLPASQRKRPGTGLPGRRLSRSRPRSPRPPNC